MTLETALMEIFKTGSPLLMLLTFIWAVLTRKIVPGWVYEELLADYKEERQLNRERTAVVDDAVGVAAKSSNKTRRRSVGVESDGE